MEQTGSPTNNAQGSLLANSFDDVYNPNLMFTNTGILALAKADNVAGRGNDDNGSQFFITNQPAPQWNFQYSIFASLPQATITGRTLPRYTPTVRRRRTPPAGSTSPTIR